MMRYSCTWAALFAAVATAAIIPYVGAQEEHFREREVLDPETDSWMAQAESEIPSGPLDEARRLLARGEYKHAYKLLKEWTDSNPDDERYLEGMYLLGDAEFERKHYYQAYEAYELVAENTTGDLFYKSLRREMDVARAFLSGEKRIVWKFMRLPAYDDGIEILDRIWERVPGTRLGETALKLKADYFFAVGDMDLAQDEYANLVREHPYGRYTKVAMLRAAESASAAFPGIKFDDRALLDAEVRYRQVLGAFPVYAEKDLDIARWYERTKRTEAAEFYYRLVVRDWPDTLAAGQAQAKLQTFGTEPTEEQPAPASSPAEDVQPEETQS